MKAVNLVPSDARNSSGPSLKMAPVTYALLGVLTAAVALVSLYVLASNNVNSRRNQMASLESQLTQAQSEATQLGSYGQFTALAQTRLQTVRGIAATRFDWHGALAELSRVIPTNTSLQSLNGTVVPGAGASAGGGGSSNLRPDLEGPAFELTGCTHTQDDVARLISRLRVMTGVQRVALGTSVKNTSAQSSSGPNAAISKHPRGCPVNAPTFNVVVFFEPVAGAGATGATSIPGSPTTPATGGAS